MVMVESMRVKLRWVYTEHGGPSDKHEYHSLYTGGYYAWSENLCPILGEFSDIYYPDTVVENVVNWSDPKFDPYNSKGFIFKVSDGCIYDQVTHSYSDAGWSKIPEEIKNPDELPEEFIDRVYHHLMIRINLAERFLFDELPPSVQSCIRRRDEVDTSWFDDEADADPTGLIYEAYHRLTDKRYIGQTTKSFDIRVQQHYREARKGSETKFHVALSAFPDDFVWQVRESDIPIADLNERERFWIAQYDSCVNGYNSTPGG